jgi:hypothetical protein
VYESIEKMASFVNRFDYFINIEDDVLLTYQTFRRILDFDAHRPIHECYHPNRLERKEGYAYCVDLLAMPGWGHNELQYDGCTLRVARNPHSGLAVLSNEKLQYAMERTDLGQRAILIGHYMASAYANLHQPFLLFRNTTEIELHAVEHLDVWLQGGRFDPRDGETDVA